jgi:hypothetical protein
MLRNLDLKVKENDIYRMESFSPIGWQIFIHDESVCKTYSDPIQSSMCPPELRKTKK